MYDQFHSALLKEKSQLCSRSSGRVGQLLLDAATVASIPGRCPDDDNDDDALAAASAAARLLSGAGSWDEVVHSEK